MDLVIVKDLFIFWMEIFIVGAFNHMGGPFSETSLLAREGKSHLETLKEKTKVPQFGQCWKNAIADLTIGCKFLSENVQSNLALKFTDCFLQTSGHEPLNCDFPKSACLQNLSDRAFNAYTEFYTHTQSICYFLQSQIWHEETEQTIDRLSATSQHVSQKLQQAEETQDKLLKQQKESLFLQHDLIDSSKNVASTLQSSQEKINNIMQDFQNSTSKQQQLLIDVLDHLLSLKSWAVNEMSWFSSTLFFMAATAVTFLFTSVSRTRGARMLIFLIFTVNYFFERYITKSMTDEIVNDVAFSTNTLYSWIWWCRKFCITLSVIVALYTAFNYYDYNLLNYQLLLEIRYQNSKILDQLAHKPGFESNNQAYELTKPKSQKDNFYVKNSLAYTVDVVDHSNLPESPINVSVMSEKQNNLKETKSAYNLRSHKVLN